MSYVHPDRLFPIEPSARSIARNLYLSIADQPIISPHGHTDPGWFALNRPFADPVSLLITPDHYVLRMLYSQGLSLEKFGVSPLPSQTDGEKPEQDSRKIWHLFAQNYFLFRATPSDLWFQHVFFEIFKIDRPFTPGNADYFFDAISSLLKTQEFLPRALFDRFKIDVLATTDGATDTLNDHAIIRDTWGKRVIPTYRPDAVVDPEHEDFFANLQSLAKLTGEDTESFNGYLNAHRTRRAFFKKHGATATDHGHPSARTEAMDQTRADKLFAKILARQSDPQENELFRAHMLWRMAEMSIDDGLVMQLHSGSYRNHNTRLFHRFGRDKGADIPTANEFTWNLQPLLKIFGNDPRLKLILFTLDESTYSRELAPLAGHYPSVLLGPAWWFHDSPEGMLRHRRSITETAGFANLTGFIDDTRAFFSIPARHDVARRIDARFLSELVCEHRLREDDAYALMQDLTSGLSKTAYRL